MKQKTQKTKHFILKYSEEKEPFSVKKLQNSLQKAGADMSLTKEIIQKIEKEPFVSNTKDIHKYAFTYLKKKNRPIAARYNMKRAIAELGPTGFPFEQFVGELLRHKGYTVKVGVIVPGGCVNHEIDIVAEKKNEHFIIECKFHNMHWIKSNVRTSLYIKARFDDIKKAWIKKCGNRKKKHQAWIITNTKFTSEAIKFAECVGIKLISWDYPKVGNLADIIDELALHPITVLTTISKKQKEGLTKAGLVLCRDISANTKLLKQIGIAKTKISDIVEESRAICRLDTL